MYPDTHLCSQFKSCTVIVFWLRDKLYRDTCSPHKYLYLDAKNRAKPSLHHASFLAPLASDTETLPGACVGLRLIKNSSGPLAAS